MKRKIIRLRYEDEQPGSYLIYAKGTEAKTDILPLGRPTSQEYAALCDQDADNCNRHDFRGAHVLLLKLIRKHTTTDLSIMQDIAKLGGLHHIIYGE